MKKLIIVAGIGVSLLVGNVGNGDEQANTELNKEIQINVTVDEANLDLHIQPFSFEQPDEN
ncbi:hypothetical protein [Exiguobacterium sp. s191]|uniref:hypothetical protein n=1 Tax=Exiguobacterium sp. s191 TaxID=2751196 RepID=UPI001BE86733|nr:hypothetical protein [Exiguobacterium sp. s191]